MLMTPRHAAAELLLEVTVRFVVAYDSKRFDSDNSDSESLGL